MERQRREREIVAFTSFLTEHSVNIQVHESDGKHRAELEHLSQEVRLLREERDRFFAELEARRNKEPILHEQIKVDIADTID